MDLLPFLLLLSLFFIVAASYPNVFRMGYYPEDVDIGTFDKRDDTGFVLNRKLVKAILNSRRY